MYTELFHKYIVKNSDVKSRKRAEQVYVKLESSDENSFRYSCEGNSDYLYDIEIEVDKKGEIKETYCSCPYDYGGICKHIIAAIGRLGIALDRGFLKIKEEKPIPENTKKSIKKAEYKKGEILLEEDGKFDIDEISKRTSWLRKIYIGLKFNLLSYDRVEVSTQDWQASQVKITRSDDGKKLFTSCSCNERDMCEHRLFVFDYIGERFGTLFFAKDYENNLIANYVQERRLQSVEEFHRFYAVQLTPEGPKLESKYPNLIAIDDFSEIFKEEIKGDEYPEIPFQNIENQEEGIGFCIGYYKEDFSQFFPISAKFNKDKNDFSSKIKRIFDYDSSLYQDKSFTDEQILAISKVNKGMNLIDARKNRDFKLGIQILSEILTHQPPFFYLFQRRKRLVCSKKLRKIDYSKRAYSLIFRTERSGRSLSAYTEDRTGRKKTFAQNQKNKSSSVFCAIRREFVSCLKS